MRPTGRAFVGLARDRVFVGYALTVAFAYASLFGYISGSSFALQDVYGLTATQFSLVFAANAAGMIVLGLLNARLVRRFPVRRLLVVGLAASTVAAARCWSPCSPARAWSRCWRRCSWWWPRRGLVSSNATVLGVQQAPAAGSASAILGALMFAGGVLVTPLMALGGEGTAVPMVAVVAGGAIAALLATALLTLRR